MSQTAATNGQEEFSAEQKEYLSGFSAGFGVTRNLRDLPSFAQTLGAGSAVGAPAAPALAGENVDHLMLEADAAQEAAGKKLVPEEKAKRELHPLDRWDQIVEHARSDKFPKGTDVLMWKYHGLFYVAPAQEAYMCRLRFYGGLISSDQLRAMARISKKFGGGYSDCTTRGNLQIREIKAADAVDFLLALHEAGLVSRGSGADNIRNVTGSATAGLDPHELYDVREMARDMHYYILNHREMYGLPRKFNISFDGGGAIATLEETNDIGFSAVELRQTEPVPYKPGVYFRCAFGGITGHKDFAKDEGVLLEAEQCVPFAAAAVRVFIKHGNRTDRKKARLKYLLDDWGHEKFVEETIKEWGVEPLKLPLEECETRPPLDRAGHIGWHAQKQDGLNYVGVVLPVGRITSAQMRGLAEISDEYGSGDCRLTVWQNLLIADVPDDKKEAVEAALLELGLDFKASGVRAGLVACTGAAGCKYANAHTKTHALEIADHLEGALEVDQHINIHLTGCNNSCAQHYIGDIGFMGTKVETSEDEDMVEGYHLYVGGGYADKQDIGREVMRNVTAENAPMVTQKLLGAYLSTRGDVLESFFDWSKRHSTEELNAFCG